MKAIILTAFVLFTACNDKDSTGPETVEEIPTKAQQEDKPPVFATDKNTISSPLDPLEKLEATNLSVIKDVNFKLLIDYDLPLADQKMAEKTDLKVIKESMPVAVRRLNKQMIKIKGYMVPLELNESNKVSVFLFAPDQTSCCFGRIPDLNGFIYCTSEKGLPNLQDILVELTGVFKSEPEYNVFDDAVYLYTMKAKSYKELSLRKPIKGPGFDF